MVSYDILYQTSCAYTPQQNRVVKRKSRHLIETTHTILIHSEVPLYFSGDVIVTACYLLIACLFWH